MNRNKKLDFIKGLLMILVVIGHYDNGKIHDFIYLFHMPAFFIISGYLLNDSKLKSKKYLNQKIFDLILPYFMYLTLDFFFAKRNFTIKELIKSIWGGRLNNGTYWYITCYCFALVIFSYAINRLKKIEVQIFILFLFLIAFVESVFINEIPFLMKPGIPWNLDVSFIAVFYIAIGYYGKKIINDFFENKEIKNNIILSFCLISGFVFVYLNIVNPKIEFYFDMKAVRYSNLFLDAFVPLIFFGVLIFASNIISKYLLHIFIAVAKIGRKTIPIMFLHVPLNYCFEYKKNIIAYCVIGLVIPIIFNDLFSKYKIMRKLFGLSQS